MKSWLLFIIVIAITWLVLCQAFYANTAYSRFSTNLCSAASNNNIPETKQLIDATLSRKLSTEELGRRLEEKSSTLQRKRAEEQTSLAIATAVGAAGIGGVIGVVGDIAVAEQLDPIVLPVASSMLLGAGSYYVVKEQNNFVSNNLGKLIGQPILASVTNKKNEIINRVEAKKRSIQEKKDSTISSIVNLPKTVQRYILDRINNIQNNIKKRIQDKTNEVLNIPNVAVQKVQNKVDETKTRTSLAIQNKIKDIQSIPSKIQISVSTYAMQKWNMITSFPKNLYTNVAKSIETQVDQINTKVKTTNDVLVSAIDTKLKVVENVTSKLIPPAPKVSPSKGMDKFDKSIAQKITESKAPDNRPKVDDSLLSKETSQIQGKSQPYEVSTQNRRNSIFDQFKPEIKSDNKSKMVEDKNTLAKLTSTEDAELKSILNAIKTVDVKPASDSKLKNNGNSKNLVASKTATILKPLEPTKESTTSLLSKPPTKANIPFALNFNKVSVDANKASQKGAVSAVSITIAANNTTTNKTLTTTSLGASSATNKFPFFNSWDFSKSSTKTKSNVSTVLKEERQIVKPIATPSMKTSAVTTNNGKDKIVGKSAQKETITVKPSSDRKQTLAATEIPTKSLFSNVFANKGLSKISSSSVATNQNLNQKVSNQQEEKFTPSILSKAALEQLKSMALPTKSIVNIDSAMLEYSKGKMTVKEVYAILVAETRSKDQAAAIMPNLIGSLPRGTLKSTLNTFYQQQAY